MITRLRIRNFKAWKDTGDVRFAPLTVFFGSNSSGKTSLHQLLLMLKQTAQSQDRRRVLHLGDQKTSVDLGTFQDMVFAHDTQAGLEFEIDWTLRETLSFTDPPTQRSFAGNAMTFGAEIGQREERVPELYVRSFEYAMRNNGRQVLKVGMKPQEAGKSGYELKVDGFDLLRRVGRPRPLPPPTRFYGFPDAEGSG